MASAALLLLCGWLTACGGGDEGAEDADPASGQEQVARAEACGGMLTPQVATVVEGLAGSPDFLAQESLSPAAIAEELTREVHAPEDLYENSGYALCAVYASETSAHMSLNITYRTPRSHELDGRTDLPEGALVYSIGREAHASSDRGVVLFDCGLPAVDGESTTVSAAVSRMGNHPEAGDEGPMMTVAHAAAVLLAEELECADDGGLTPEPDLRPVA
ncbi:hypothetical protein [Streptomyces avicenniae]|uniref:hypothetical protein n=1 Tax=Streptomyces avicenniae TaxID=500153 RepID=UPI00069A5E06|nr:hypothetical protein [Streptomyces avicenniae]